MSVEERVPNERLRHARSLRGWSQAKLAEEVGTSFEMVSRWERGVTIPTLYFRAQLCEALGMTAEEFGLVHGSSELLAIPTSPFVFLACSYADHEKAVLTRAQVGSAKAGYNALERPSYWEARAGATPEGAGRSDSCCPDASTDCLAGSPLISPCSGGAGDRQNVPASDMWCLDRGGELAGVPSLERAGIATGA